MTLDDFASLATIFGIFIGAPIGSFKIWRKLDNRLTEQDKRLIRIEYQLYENGGLSLKDQMNRACADINELKINQAVIKTRINA
jgi:hypothetical protein